MKSIVFIGAVCLQLSWSSVTSQRNGVGAFSYQDSTGNRYGGTYDLKDGKVVDSKGTFPPDFSPPDFTPPDFSPPIFGGYEDPDLFLTEYFKNLQNLLQDNGYFYPLIPLPRVLQIPQYIPPTPFMSGRLTYHNIPNIDINRAFQANIENQKVALNAAKKAFDLTSNQAGYIHNLNPSRFPFNDFQAYGGFPDMSNAQFPFQDYGNSGSSAYAGAAVGPGYEHQVAYISPGNPNMPNINRQTTGSGSGGYKSVSVSSYASSSNTNGNRFNKQGAKTTINDNGNVKTYETHSP